MHGALAVRRSPLNRVISVELPDSSYAENLAQEMRDLFPAATFERKGSVDVGVYGVGGENRLIIEVLGAVQLWLNRAPDRTEPVRVRYGDKLPGGAGRLRGEAEIEPGLAAARLNH